MMELGLYCRSMSVGSGMLFLFLFHAFPTRGLEFIPSFSGKKIVVGVTGSIAAFKVAGWVSSMAKDEARVKVIMTPSAMRFVTPLTFAALSGEKVCSDMFVGDEGPEISHIELGKDADLILVAPATAQTIARLAHGLADDLLSATVLAARARNIIVCPAMNSRMYAHPATQANIARLKGLGYQVIEPASGMMACKDEGQGRLPEWDQICEDSAALSVRKRSPRAKDSDHGGPHSGTSGSGAVYQQPLIGQDGICAGQDRLQTGCRCDFDQRPHRPSLSRGNQTPSSSDSRGNAIGGAGAFPRGKRYPEKTAAVADFRPESPSLKR